MPASDNFIVPTAPSAARNNQAASTAFVMTQISAVTAQIAAGAGLLNINTLTSSPLVPDGVTSNVPMLASLAPVLQGVAPEMPVPVNITVGTPTVLSIDPTVPSGGTLANPALHYLKPNQGFYLIPLSLGATLPNGMSFNTAYYLTVANLTATTFTFSTTNNYNYLSAEGPTVNTTGSVTGTIGIVLTGRDINLFIPSGPYFGGNFGDPVPNTNVTPNGVSRIRYHAYGAIFDTKITLATDPPRASFDAATWNPTTFDYVDTTPTQVSQAPDFDAVLTLLTPANTANYYIGQWVSIFGVDIQDPPGTLTSGPTSNHFQEFKRIKAKGVGTITLDGPLKWVYLSTFPNLFNAVGLIGGGPAMIIPMHPAWDTEIEVIGARWIGQPQSHVARRVTLKDCVFVGYGDFPGNISPSLSQSFVYRNCRFGPGDAPGASTMEVDKMLEYLEIDSCTIPNHYPIFFPSTSLQTCVIKNLQGALITGTPRQIRIVDSIVAGLTVGPDLGVTDSVQTLNSRFTTFDMTNRNDDNNAPPSPTNDMTLVPNWSFSNGTFTRNISGLPGLQGMSWQIPGAKIYFTDAGNTYKYYQNMGGVFAILNTYMSGSNFSFDTTLSAVPTRQTSSNVSITVASPSVVTWTAHGQIAGTAVCLTTTGSLPSPLSISTIYYVASSPAPTTNTFSLAATVGGSAINTTGSLGGVQTAYANPLCFRPHPCPRFTSIGNTGCNTIMDQNGSIDLPLFSQVIRSFVGKQTASTTAEQQPYPRIWGAMTAKRFMTVNVIKAGTSGTLNISCPGFTQPNLANSAFSQTIDLTVAGVRTVNNTAVTGLVGADSIAPYADWVAGPLIFTWASPPATATASPIVEFEMYTDQGLTRFGNMQGAPQSPSGNDQWNWVDSGIIQQYNTVP